MCEGVTVCEREGAKGMKRGLRKQRTGEKEGNVQRKQLYQTLVAALSSQVQGQLSLGVGQDGGHL